MLGLRNKEFTVKIRVRTTLTNKAAATRIHRALEAAFYDAASATIQLDADIQPGRLASFWSWFQGLIRRRA